MSPCQERAIRCSGPRSCHRRKADHAPSLHTGRPRAGCSSSHAEEQAHGAAKCSHDGIRRQKKKHWDDFLSEDVNIRSAAEFLDPSSLSVRDKIPQLVRTDGSSTTDKADQAAELLATIFPPLPADIANEGARPTRSPVVMPQLTTDEVERSVVKAKPWKAP